MPSPSTDTKTARSCGRRFVRVSETGRRRLSQRRQSKRQFDSLDHDSRVALEYAAPAVHEHGWPAARMWTPRLTLAEVFVEKGGYLAKRFAGFRRIGVTHVAPMRLAFVDVKVRDNTCSAQLAMCAHGIRKK